MQASKPELKGHYVRSSDSQLIHFNQLIEFNELKDMTSISGKYGKARHANKAGLGSIMPGILALGLMGQFRQVGWWVCW